MGCITSAERGVLSTACMCMSATGHFIPPFIIFPRVRMTQQLKQGAPPGTVFSCNPSGWMTAKDFNRWFEHFIQQVHPTETNPVLLILDGHSSHTRNLEFVDRARECHVIVLSLPPHCSHKLQPLDVSFMGPFKTHFSQAIEDWLKNKPGEVVTLNEISTLLGKAYLRAASVSVAVNGFRKTGIAPFNRFVFSDADFAPAEVTDIPVVQPTIPNYPDSENEGPFLGFDIDLLESLAFIPIKESTLTKVSNEVDSDHETPNPSSNLQPLSLESLDRTVTSHPTPPVVPTPSTHSSSFKISPATVRPLPKSNRRKIASTRKSEKSSIITSSPHRSALKVLQANKDIKNLKKMKRISKTQAEKGRKRVSAKENFPQDTLCSYCGDQFSASTAGDGWNQCHRCHSWVHNCTDVMCSCND